MTLPRLRLLFSTPGTNLLQTSLLLLSSIAPQLSRPVILRWLLALSDGTRACNSRSTEIGPVSTLGGGVDDTTVGLAGWCVGAKGRELDLRGWLVGLGGFLGHKGNAAFLARLDTDRLVVDISFMLGLC
jgi:hypothetical protein